MFQTKFENLIEIQIFDFWLDCNKLKLSKRQAFLQHSRLGYFIKKFFYQEKISKKLFSTIFYIFPNNSSHCVFNSKNNFLYIYK